MHCVKSVRIQIYSGSYFPAVQMQKSTEIRANTGTFYAVMVKRIEEEFRCSFEELYSRILFHLSKCCTPSIIVIWTVYTDVFINALGSLYFLWKGIQVWMETGLVTDNTLRYININIILDYFGIKFCMVLSAFCAFSGYDFTFSCNEKSKVRPLKQLEKDDIAQQVFSKLNEWDAITVEDIRLVESFVCGMYGKIDSDLSINCVWNFSWRGASQTMVLQLTK